MSTAPGEPAPEAGAAARIWGPILVTANNVLLRYAVLPGIAAGSLLWLDLPWSDVAFVFLLLVGDLLAWLAPHGGGYAAMGTPALGDTARSLLRTAIVLVAVAERTAGPAAERPEAWSVAGLALCLLGIFLQRAATAAFARSGNAIYISTRPQVLIDGGVYRFLRHPVYTGLFALTLGAVLLLRSLWGAALTATVYAAALAWRIRREEAGLYEIFGDDYRAYAARVKRFVPYLA